MRHPMIALLLGVAAAACQPTISVDGYAVSCAGTDGATCYSVSALAIGNMGLSRPTAPIAVTHRPSCPAVPDWADSSNCWQVTLSVGSEIVCMVVARRPTLGGFGQVAGDQPGLQAKPKVPTGCPA